MRAALPLLSTVVLFGCAEPEVELIDDWPEGLAPLQPLSSGACPDFETSGRKTFVSGGIERQVHVYIPEYRRADMPALFFWHPLGASAGMVANLMRAQTLADQFETVFVLPQAQSDEPYEWQFYVDDGGLDAVLYDDLRACVVQELGVDPLRVTSAGMSAGGLWNSWMTMHRADTLATTLVMSGGTGQVVYYDTPNADIPVMVMWGGEADTFSLGARTVDFHAQSVQFSERLQADGHFVVECDHGEGHTIPLTGIGVIPAWLTSHVFGEPSPFEDGDLSSFPDYCTIPDKAAAD